jgi:alcohol dehydrogenase class IV
MPFEFATATRILFGPGKRREAVPLMAEMGKRALLVTGTAPRVVDEFDAALRDRGVTTTTFGVSGEPTIEMVADATSMARSIGVDLVVSLGGGSAIDAGKAVAAMLANGGELLDYVEVIGGGKPITKPSVPYVAVPTTAGTGSEVTRNAVLASHEHRVKVSLRSPLMLARLAVVDPELTLTVPPAVTASTGLDALTQLIEPYVCNAPNPLTDAICREGIPRAARSLRRAFEDGSDAAAREDMAVASLFGGLALANAKLGAVHGLAAPLGGMFPAPHGAVCARLLPLVMRTNVRALESRAPESLPLRRYAEIARLLTGDLSATADDGAAWVEDLCANLAIPPLSNYGLSRAGIPDVVSQAARASSMKGNPIPLTDGEVSDILVRSLAP